MAKREVIYAYENDTTATLTLHYGWCSWCKHGAGMNPRASLQQGGWIMEGDRPWSLFGTVDDAKANLEKRLGKWTIATCSHCIK